MCHYWFAGIELWVFLIRDISVTIRSIFEASWFEFWVAIYACAIFEFPTHFPWVAWYLGTELTFQIIINFVPFDWIRCLVYIHLISVAVQTKQDVASKLDCYSNVTAFGPHISSLFSCTVYWMLHLLWTLRYESELKRFFAGNFEMSVVMWHGVSSKDLYQRR